MRSPPQPYAQTAAIAFGVFAVAFLVRLLFIYQWHVTTPYGPNPVLDAAAYDFWARDILSGHWLRDEAFYQSPLYPYLLSLAYAVSGSNLLVASLFNALLGALSCAVLAQTAGQCFGKTAAIATGVLAAFYRPFIFYSAPAMKETLGILLLSLFLSFAVDAIERNRARSFFLGGLFLGLAALTRGNVLLLAPAFVVFAIARGRHAALKGCMFFLIASGLAIIPATFHNAVASHDFVLINYNGGFNLYIGNSPSASPTNTYPPGISTNPFKENFEVTKAAEAALGSPLRPSQVSNYWSRQAFDFILHNPAATLSNIVLRAILFWDDNEIRDNYDTDGFVEQYDTVLSWPLPGFLEIMFVAALSLGAVWRTQRSAASLLLLFAGVYMLSVLPFHITDRYRLPVTVFLLPLAGAALPCGIDIVHSLRRKNERGNI